MHTEKVDINLAKHVLASCHVIGPRCQLQTVVVVLMEAQATWIDMRVTETNVMTMPFKPPLPRASRGLNEGLTSGAANRLSCLLPQAQPNAPSRNGQSAC